jgi:protein-S-isoprenylcysteine O-methyltransferase Ste14
MSDAERPGVGFPPWVIYIACFLAGVGLELASPTDALPVGLAIAAGVAGFALWAALDGAAMVRFSRAETSMQAGTPVTALVTSGPYRFTRNPMYLGMAFLYAGLALALGVIWALAFLPIVLIVVDRIVIPPEERYLEAKFGDEYCDYKRRVRRWI